MWLENLISGDFESKMTSGFVIGNLENMENWGNATIRSTLMSHVSMEIDLIFLEYKSSVGLASARNAKILLKKKVQYINQILNNTKINKPSYRNKRLNVYNCHK